MIGRSIYVVYNGAYGHIEDIEAVFETREQVEAFKKRFAKNVPLKVYKTILNPAFTSIPEKVPYLVSFNRSDSEPDQVTLLCGIEECQKAIKGTVVTEDYFTYIYLMADNKTDAIRLARLENNNFLQTDNASLSL